MKDIDAKKILERLKLKNEKISKHIDLTDMNSILHELDVFEAELLAQNEELQQKEILLIEAKDEYENLFNNAPIFYIMLDERLSVVKYNIVSDNFFNFSAMKVKTKSMLNFIQSNDTADFFEFLDRTHDLNKTVTINFNNYDRSLRTRFKLSKQIHKHNTENFYLLTLTNVQQEYDHLEELKRIEELFKKFFYDTPDATFLMDDGKFVDCNKATLDIFGYDSKEELLKLHLSELSAKYQPDGKLSCEKINEMIGLCMQHGNHRFEWVHLRKNAQEFWTDVTLTKIDLDQKEMIYINFKDISFVKEQEKIMIQQSKLAAMGEMLANIAHQWKQPLMMLSMGILALQKKYSKGNLSPEYMDSYNEKTHALIDQMNQTIRDFSQYFSPGKSAHNFHISSCIEKSVSFLQPILKKKSISLDLELPSESEILGFENELSQVILNLLKNSVDAIVENDSKEGLIKIGLQETQAEWLVTIEDNGGGVSKDIIERIFEPYFTTKYKSEGTGIGLYMSKLIIENSLKGALEVRNNETGAIFTIKLPKEK